MAHRKDLSFEELKEIESALNDNLSWRAIAFKLKISEERLYHELSKCPKGEFSAEKAFRHVQKYIHIYKDFETYKKIIEMHHQRIPMLLICWEFDLTYNQVRSIVKQKIRKKNERKTIESRIETIEEHIKILSDALSELWNTIHRGP